MYFLSSDFDANLPVGSSSVNLIIPVQGAEGPAVEKTFWKVWLKICCNVACLLEGLWCVSYPWGGLYQRDP